MPRWLFPLVAFDFAGTPGAQSIQALPPPTSHPHSSGRLWLADLGLLGISEPCAVWSGAWLTQLGKNLLPGSSSHHCPQAHALVQPSSSADVVELLKLTHIPTVNACFSACDNHREVLIVIHDRKKLFTV